MMIGLVVDVGPRPRHREERQVHPSVSNEGQTSDASDGRVRVEPQDDIRTR
jgi:hypothetical protein